MESRRTINHRRKIDWKKGGSELLSMALVLPIFCWMIVSLVTLMQKGVIRQTLEHATYMSARAAVVCETPSSARAQAQSTARSTMSSNSFGITPEDIQVSVELVGGTTSTTSSTSLSSGGITWEKGALAKCEVTVPYITMTGREESITSTIYMMVEKPARRYG